MRCALKLAYIYCHGLQAFLLKASHILASELQWVAPVGYNYCEWCISSMHHKCNLDHVRHLCEDPETWMKTRPMLGHPLFWQGNIGHLLVWQGRTPKYMWGNARTVYLHCLVSTCGAHCLFYPILFASWGLHILGAFLLAPGRRKYLIVAIDYITSWVEAKSLSTILSRHHLVLS